MAIGLPTALILAITMVWSSETWKNPGASAVLSDDCVLTIQSENGDTLWQSLHHAPEPVAAPTDQAGGCEPTPPLPGYDNFVVEVTTTAEVMTSASSCGPSIAVIQPGQYVVVLDTIGGYYSVLG